jgi:hypothetical protein
MRMIQNKKVAMRKPSSLRYARRIPFLDSLPEKREQGSAERLPTRIRRKKAARFLQRSEPQFYGEKED